MHERDGRLVSQDAGITAGDDPLCGFVQNDAALSHEEDARQLVSDDDDGDAEVAAQGDDQLIQLVSGDPRILRDQSTIPFVRCFFTRSSAALTASHGV